MWSEAYSSAASVQSCVQLNGRLKISTLINVVLEESATMTRKAQVRADDPLKLSNQLCFAVYSAAHAFSAAYKPLLDPLGLTYPQYLVLLVLWERDGLAVKDIGQQLQLDSGTLTPILKRLEAAGFVSRRRDPADERHVRINLSARGQEIRSLALEGQRALISSLGKSEDDVQLLRQTVNDLNRLLRDSSQRCKADAAKRAA
jgi:DNA-binding MarR family transcriptional regulator